MMKRLRGIIFFTVCLYGYACAQKTNDVYVDQNGVMRWGKTKQEVQGFGVNYTAPFAHAYRSAKKLNVDLEKAIDDDVYHFARLGFDAYRVHVWDTEISDTVGNLLENEHLRLFDYMLKKMKERGMKFILTPIAYWGNGYPEQEERTPGFSRKYGKDACLTNEDAIEAQENYLFQFLNHVNPYTNVAYKNDPDVVAFEISNEPHHREEPARVTAFIKRMLQSMRRTGCKKPIFYNISHSIHLVDAYYAAGIDGGTFQWYPTGLGAQHELRGNFLPNVDRYTIPFAANPKFKKGPKIVYEFDAADVGRSYIYPAIARSFRAAGIQWATHFAYDPTYLAYANTEYNTHYMNLAYAPQKALSLKLAGEVFHHIPMNKTYGDYPANSSFGPFYVSYEKDLAEMVTDEKFIYTNNTTTNPPSPDKLNEIAGTENSPVVTYEGTGAYFLDRIEGGVWRLEVMPDAVWVDNIFGRNSLKKEVAVVNWRTWPMWINLPDLGDDYSLVSINEGNNYTTKVSGRSFNIRPGTYLLVRKGTVTKVKGNDRWKNITLKEFVAPTTTVKKTYVIHSPRSVWRNGSPMNIQATVVSTKEPESIEVSVYGRGWRPKVIQMKRVSGYHYEATIPADDVVEGFLRYYITVNEADGSRTFPSDINAKPSDWDFYDSRPYEVHILKNVFPLHLFDALQDENRLSRHWLRTSSVVPLADPGDAEVRIVIEKLFSADPENAKGEKIYDYSMRYFCGDKISDRDLSGMKKIIVRGHSLNEGLEKIQLALVTKRGMAYGGILEINTQTGDYALDIGGLKKVKLVTLPRPYPTFLPYFFESNLSEPLNLGDVEVLQISIGPGLSENEVEKKHAVAIESIRLE
ncbi:MAG TPA: cellulase family glycosylhydrolase [Cyclobacteriaceae bacterium]|nr:cellulase family glycosylhydrolase [Cyclobacteriaceae bacterium]